MSIENDILSEFVDKRVLITGVFDKCSTVTRANSSICTALLQDCYLLVEGEEHDLGHRWLQYTDELKRLGIKAGDRIKCSCRVREYKKYSDMADTKTGSFYEIKQSLSYPTNIEILNRTEATPTEEDDEPKNARGKRTCPQCKEQISVGFHSCPHCGHEFRKQPAAEPDTKVATPTPVEAVSLIVEVRRVAKLAGGMDALSQLVEALR